jgi:hypothetical protein
MLKYIYIILILIIISFNCKKNIDELKSNNSTNYENNMKSFHDNLFGLNMNTIDCNEFFFNNLLGTPSKRNIKKEIWFDNVNIEFIELFYNKVYVELFTNNKIYPKQFVSKIIIENEKIPIIFNLKINSSKNNIFKLFGNIESKKTEDGYDVFWINSVEIFTKNNLIKKIKFENAFS